MSSGQDQIRAVAERIARRLAKDATAEDPVRAAGGANVAVELAALRIELAELRKKLAHIESHITHDKTCAEGHEVGEPQRRDRQGGEDWRDRQGGESSALDNRMPLSSSTYIPAVKAPRATHPSGERFGVGEAVSELVNFFEREETCRMEPGDKPCDHCAMCSTRGF